MDLLINDKSALKKYKDALRAEKKFLMQGGGRKYRVNNGKLIGDAYGRYTYSFELEAELYISDDAPISLKVDEKTYSGVVTMCENFQIVIEMSERLGDKIFTAYISVEPWKLLEAIEERMLHDIGLDQGIVNELLENGTALSTSEPIEKILKGQDAVIKHIDENPITIVWGPPGTGKTHTISQAAINYLAQNKSVLLVSHSNVSVDGVAKKIFEMLQNGDQSQLYYDGKILRYGYIRDEELARNEYVSSFLYATNKNSSIAARLEQLQKNLEKLRAMSGDGITQKIVDIHKQIKKLRATVKDDEKKYVENAKIVATTISKVVMDKLFEEKKYDVVIFDEVSMAYVPQVICAATYCKEHFVCVGDFMQLPPIAQSEAKSVLCEDIFTYLGINKYGKPYYHPWLVMLDEQRRMYPDISSFVNKYVYQHMLKDHISVKKSRIGIVESNPFYGKAMNLVDTAACYAVASKNEENSRYNILSAILSFGLAVETEQENDSVSIITPYSAQTRLVRAFIQDYRDASNKTNIRCATVHQFQGSESDAIVFDAVESFPGERAGYLLGKELFQVKRLINVAVTRAKGKFITVANSRFWNKAFDVNHIYVKLLSYIQSNGNVVEHANKGIHDEVLQFDLGKNMSCYADNSYMDALLKDISKCKKRLILSLPSADFDQDIRNDFIKAIQKVKQSGQTLLIKCNEYEKLPPEIKEFSWQTDNAYFPLIMIDDDITWYGAPFANWKFVMKQHNSSQESYGAATKIACRIKGKYTYEMISSLTDIMQIENSGIRSIVRPKDKHTKILTDENKGDGTLHIGLSAYVKQTQKCSKCKKALKMIKGKSGKTILWCNDCKSSQLLSYADVNHYINKYNVKCPAHNDYIEAKVGPYGLYCKCDQGHYVDLFNI